MRNYRERLRAPASWWVLGFITMITFASFCWAGFSPAIGITAYVVLVGGPALALLLWGRSSVEVSDGILRTGTARLPLSQAGRVQALDEEQTRQLRGPQADPAAMLRVRAYLRRAVFIEITGEDPAVPYWLVGTRHPEELAGAIERSRPLAHAGDAPVG